MVVRSLFLAILAILLSPAGTFAAPININSDFSSGLTAWSASGDIVQNSGVITVHDLTGGGTLLQSTNTGPGSFVVSFDIINSLAPKGDPGFNQGVFADIASGSLYFSDTALTLSTLSGNSSTVLFDADSSGVVSSLQMTSLGNGWFNYSLAFTTSYNYITPVFDLFDQDFVQNSSLHLDNVKIEAASAPIPEPASMLLLASALPFIRRKAH